MKNPKQVNINPKKNKTKSLFGLGKRIQNNDERPYKGKPTVVGIMNNNNRKQTRGRNIQYANGTVIRHN